MVGLADIVPLTESVNIRGKKLTVRGISGEDLNVLQRRFPMIDKLLSGNFEISVREELASVGPEIIGAIIAAGFGKIGDDKEEKAARVLTLNDQILLVEPIIIATFPGVRPFVQAIKENITQILKSGLNNSDDDLGKNEVVPSGKDLDSTSPPPPRN